MGDYRKLEVWKRSRVFTGRMRQLVKHLPPDERAVLGDQLIRAADSIRFNIVEGCGFNSDPQLARCLLLSLGSANEVQDELESLHERNLIRAEDEDLAPEVSEIRAMISGLHRRVSRKKRRGE